MTLVRGWFFRNTKLEVFFWRFLKCNSSTTRSFWRSSSRGNNHTTTSTFGIRTSTILKWNRYIFKNLMCNKTSGILTCFFTSVVLIFGARGSLNSTCFNFSRLCFLQENTQHEAKQCLKWNHYSIISERMW